MASPIAFALCWGCVIALGCSCTPAKVFPKSTTDLPTDGGPEAGVPDDDDRESPQLSDLSIVRHDVLLGKSEVEDSDGTDSGVHIVADVPLDQGESPCFANCEGRECGDDGCGGSCGTCEKRDCEVEFCDEVAGHCFYHMTLCCCFYDSHCATDNPCVSSHCDAETNCCVDVAIPLTCCEYDDECDDGDPCTLGQCEDGLCSIAPNRSCR